MCGISGIYNFKSLAPADPTLVREMTRRLAHRGPDAEGFHFDGPVGLGHRRLSILDLSERGRQPMFWGNDRFAIVLNGEIYNYIELRQGLVARGHTLRTGTDTEVLLALFAEQGPKCLSQLEGMFAFAVWDAVERTLFIARDRVGIKPLYYVVTPDGMMFASELKAFTASERFVRRVALPLVETYFTFGYVPGSEAMLEGCQKLLPGQWMSVGPDGMNSGSYWDVQYAPDSNRSESDTAEQLRTLLTDSIKKHLRSDVPVGVFLSGGLDSSTTVALLAEAGVTDLKTFCVAYDEGADYDESRYARVVADRYQTDHHVLYVDSKEFQSFIPGYVWHMDEPVTEAPALSLYFVSRLLRQHATVALSGEGSDELFAGYETYRRMLRFETYRKLPAVVRMGVFDPLASLTRHQKVMAYARQARLPLDRRYFGVPYNNPVYKDLLYTEDFVSAAGTGQSVLAPYYNRSTDWDALSRMLYIDLKTWLVDDLLIKADKMTMAHGLELRVPFLDHRVVEFAATIPSSMKIRKGESKWILKQAMRGRLPDEILTRRKQGFPTPLNRMFQRDLSGYVRDLLLSSRATSRGYFKRDAVERLIEEHMSKTTDHHIVLWKLIVLEEWHRQFVDGDVAPCVPTGRMNVPSVAAPTVSA
jgi:asparagine synthase (glutamine-hydrolysing)